MPNECLQCSKACGDAIFCPDCQATLLDRLRQQGGTRFVQDSWDALHSHGVDIAIAELSPMVIETTADVSEILNASEHGSTSTPVPLVEDASRLERSEEPGQQRKLGKNTSLLQRYFWRNHSAQIRKLVVQRNSQVVNQIAHDEQEALSNPLTPCPTRPMVAVTLSDESTARQRLQFLRRAFIVMVVLAVVVLAVDGGLLVLVTGAHHNQSPAMAAPPLLALSPTVVHLGQVAMIHISHFPATSRVLVTRDIGEPARSDQNSPFVRLDTRGMADIRVLIDSTWGVGTHYIEAEDAVTHYTASSVVRVVSTGQERPPQLMIDQHTVSLGSDYVGANTLQQIFLQNAGGGTVSWLAKSDQPWLSFAPMQGLFSTRQPLTVAVSRAHLLPGNYQGTVTFYSNAGPAVHVQVSMAVRALPTHIGGVLSVAPAATSFVTTDGGVDPAEQDLTISNPGTKMLHWSLNQPNPTYASDQDVPLSSKTLWLAAQPSTGDLAPGLTATIHITTHSRTLLPGSYSSVLSFSSSADTLNAPQPVALSLTIQQRCGPALSMTDFSLTGFSGQELHTHQNMRVSLPATCVGKMAWHAFSLASWLSVSPDNGLLQEHDNALSALSADSTHLKPGSYVSAVVFTSEQRTLTLPVQFTVFPSRASSGNQASQGTMPGHAGSARSTPTGKSGMPTGTANATASHEGVSSGGGTPQTSGNTQLWVSSTSLSFTVTRGQNAAVQTVTLMDLGSDSLVWQASSD
jgi:hypothetical protein